MTYQQFVSKWTGKFIDFDKNKKYWCVDAFRQYCVDVLGISGWTIPPVASAKQIFDKVPDGGNAKFEKIYNTKTNIPIKGDIIIWGWFPGVTGIDGHVAICDTADLFTVIANGQNYPTGRPFGLTKYGTNKMMHGYRGVRGWLRGKK
jgi:hypothetical protein